MRVKSIRELSIDQCARLYLSASYLYYWCQVSMMRDEVYDKLCRRLVREFDSLSSERKQQINIDDLKVGTCLKPEASYSAYTVSASKFWIDWDDKAEYTE